MNNSSAYNNVLLKPLVPAQTVQPAASKRSYQDDQLPTSFEQRFKDANDNVRAENARTKEERSAKPVARKAEPTNNRKPDSEVQKKPSVPANRTSENNAREKVNKSEKTNDQNERFDASKSTDTSTIDNESTSKNPVRKTRTNEEPVDDAVATTTTPASDANLNNVAANLLLTTPNIPVVAPAAAKITLIPAPVVADISAASEVPADVLTSPLGVIDPTVFENVTSENITSENGNVKSVGADANLSQTNVEQPVSVSGETVTPDADASVVIAQQLLTDSVVPKTDSFASQVTGADATDVLAVQGSLAMPKSALAQTSLTPTDESTTDVSEDVISSVLTSITGEKAPVKSTGASDPSVPAKSDTAPVQTQAAELKPTFEKTMQTLVLPESTLHDDAKATPSAPQAGAAIPSTSALESMLRVNDAQTPAARSFVVQTAVPIPLGQPQWSQAVGEKVLWLAAQNVSAAEIHLNPENLGPMQVKVSVNQEQTTINFTSHHAVVRETLDQNLGRLRDMFSEQGLNLVNVDVSDKSFSRQQGDAKDQKGQATSNDNHIEEEAPTTMSAIIQKRLVDHYA